jgi:hypothetical protein
VIVLPDFVVVSGVPRTLAGAEALWKAAIDPALGHAGVTTQTNDLNTWVLPYSCLILLCEFYKSHGDIYLTGSIRLAQEARQAMCRRSANLREE